MTTATISETMGEFDVGAVDAMYTTLDSVNRSVRQPPGHLISMGAFMALPETSRTSARPNLLNYDKAEISKSINLTTQSTNIW